MSGFDLFIDMFTDVEIKSSYIPTRDTFYLTEEYYNACVQKDRSKVPYGRATREHSKQWLAYFGSNSFEANDKNVIIYGLANTFPHTSPETFDHWMTIRSQITPEDELNEKFLQPDPDRVSLFPIIQQETYNFRKTIERLNWTAQEVTDTLRKDHRDLAKISLDEISLIENTLGFFAVADELVNEGIDTVIRKKLVSKEDIHYLDAQMNQEDVHSESYSLQVQEIVPVERQQEIRDRVKTSKTVGAMSDWVRWWIVGDHPTADLVVMMAFLEGGIFSGFFSSIQFFKSRNLFEGMTLLNEFIVRDENWHCKFWVHTHNRLLKKTDLQVAHAIARATVQLSETFFAGSIPAGIVGFNCKLVNQYVQSRFDDVLQQLKYSTIYNVASPFGFMDALSLNSVAKTNFFEHETTQYSGLEDNALEFAIDTSDFKPFL
jgi:ribonucleoside-diphosphate reductase subunit M2